jgi:hypothetical protein
LRATRTIVRELFKGRVRKVTQIAVASALGATGLMTIAPLAQAATATAQPHTVALDCSQDGGDARTTADASVQPGVIVADSSGYPYFPVTYTPFTIDPDGQLEPIGPDNTIGTTDHLVAVWQNSTDCFATPYSRNAWVTDSSGSVFGESDLSGPVANNFGDMGGTPLNQPMVGMTPTADANGYWEVAADGGIFAFGDASFYGSMGGVHLNQPIAGMAVTPEGHGYWMVANDGGIFAFGDAGFYGSMGSVRLNQPIEAMTPTPDGRGYWMVASDGGVFAFGDAQFHGSTGGMTLPSPIAGMIPNGNGYTLIAQDGTEYPFGG